MQLLQMLADELTPDRIQSLAQTIGATPQQTEQAAGAAVPALVSGLASQAQAGNAEGLLSLLDSDGDGAPDLGALGGLLGGGGGLGGMLGGMLGGSAGGADPLASLLGGKLGPVAEGIARASGLSAAQVQQLLGALVPIVMGALAKLKSQDGLDASALTSALQAERNTIAQRTGRPGGLASLLDQDGDGSVADDVADLAAKGLGSLLR